MRGLCLLILNLTCLQLPVVQIDFFTPASELQSRLSLYKKKPG
jgi:hypothetical protein